jgi:hypothetical protein
LIELNKDKEFAVNVGNYNALILAEPKMEDDFKEKLEDAGYKYRNNRFMCVNNIGYSRGSSESSSAFKKNNPVMYYFDNHVTTLEYIMNLVDSVVKQEGEKGFNRMKLYCDFGIMIEESKDSIQDPYRYHYQTPLDRNTHRSIPIIIKDDETREKYKQIVKDTIIQFQEKALSSTKHKIVAIYSMMIVSFRLPIVGRKQEQWVKEHIKQNTTRSVAGPNNLCWFEAATFVSNPDPTGKRIYDCSRIAIAKQDFIDWWTYVYGPITVTEKRKLRRSKVLDKSM